MSKKKSKAKSKAKTKKQSQTKIPGTGRLDADPNFEEQAEKVRKLTESRMEIEGEERMERDKLTELHRARGGDVYTYEDEDGELRDVVLPGKEEPTSKVRKHKGPNPNADVE